MKDRTVIAADIAKNVESIYAMTVSNLAGILLPDKYQPPLVTGGGFLWLEFDCDNEPTSAALKQSGIAFAITSISQAHKAV